MAKVIGHTDTLKRALTEVLGDGQKGPDEFTAYDLMRESPGSTCAQIRFRLQNMERRGELTVRKLLIDGKWTNAYRFVER